MSKLLRWIAPVTALAALAVAAPAQASSSSCANADALPAQLDVNSYDTAVLCLINAERTSRGMVALKTNRKLARAAVAHSNSMATRSYLSHTEPGGTTFSQRMVRSGYKRGTSRWMAGENIGMGAGVYGSPGAMVTGFMNSPVHRHNILNPSFREIGIGVVHGAPRLAAPDQGVTITTDFGRRIFG
jgi:uncharacterized protein YkwD